MNKTFISPAIILRVGFSACTSWSNYNSQTKKEEKIEISNKEKVVALLKSIEIGEQEPLGYINPNKYIQHNLGVADGFAGFREMLQQLPLITSNASLTGSKNLIHSIWFFLFITNHKVDYL